MARVVPAHQLPRLASTRDTRDRVDLVTAELFGLTDLRADRITYHPGDTAAAHLHRDARHFFFVLEGRGVLHGDDEPVELGAGDVALVEADEVHWLENPHSDDFTFIELWVPAPTETIWVSDDRCTWRPAALEQNELSGREP
jgi:mannose-6-phosphate isomerase-like protein (cupin superfamily)